MKNWKGGFLISVIYLIDNILLTVYVSGRKYEKKLD